MTFKSCVSIRKLITRFTHRLLDPVLREVIYLRRRAYMQNEEALYRNIHNKFLEYEDTLSEEVNRIVCEYFNFSPELFIQSLLAYTEDQRLQE